MTKDGKLIGIGCAGAVVAGLCCFTPLLVVSLGALGLAAFVGWWLDLILFPALALFLVVLGYGIHLRRRRATAPDLAETGDRRT